MITGKQLVVAASKFAANAHRGQFRLDEKTPYFAHVVDVAQRYLKMRPNDDGRGEAVALLHDVLEDTDVTVDQLTEAGFGELVPDLLLLRHGNETYLEYLLKIKQSSPIYISVVRDVKLVDVEANLADVKNIPSASLRKRLTDKYEMARYILNSL